MGVDEARGEKLASELLRYFSETFHAPVEVSHEGVVVTMDSHFRLQSMRLPEARDASAVEKAAVIAVNKAIDAVMRRAAERVASFRPR